MSAARRVSLAVGTFLVVAGLVFQASLLATRHGRLLILYLLIVFAWVGTPILFVLWLLVWHAERRELRKMQDAK